MTRWMILVVMGAILEAQAVQDPTRRTNPGKEGTRTVSEKTIYEFSVKDIDGKDVPLSRYKGNVLMIVNVASK